MMRHKMIVNIDDIARGLVSPILFLDEGGRILSASVTALAFLQHQSAVYVVEGVLRLRREEEEATWRAVLGCAAPHHTFLTLRSRTGSPVTLLSIDRPISNLLIVSISVLEGAGVRPPSPQMLRDTFRFSRRETDVALGILMGLRPTDIAQTLSISVETVRSHLKSAMAKAGCTQQAQLALLLARLPSET
ncbi:hypothetical protein EOD42_07625 [Rhodovarius crocodyli]|uniref:HTH luxR-type domain-containing protein n=2 Tax=Rhodovarius crocodyli TaxID=1979269 RepID=A0A437MJ88_9PROT|nr:hypothetical protein EOD42_07625 [Rhodovarius crocodyli]